MTTVAVIGGGFSGTLAAIHLLRHGLRVVLVERGDRLARGAAYATPWPEHRLNVRAANMGAFPDDPGHFARWCAGHPHDHADPFRSRAHYGDYLAGLLAAADAAAPGQLVRRRAGAVALRAAAQGYAVALDDGPDVPAAAVVLAIGNLAPPDPAGVDRALLGDRYLPDPWGGDVAAGLPDGAAIGVVGTGLSMVDVALRAAAAGRGLRVVALSRHGLVPHAHDDAAPPGPATPPPADLPVELSRLVAAMRVRAAAVGWRTAVDGLRPVTQRLWADAPPAVRRRFLRHLRPWWDIHRHRIAPSVAGTLAELRGAGRLAVLAGRLVAAEPAGEGLRLRWRPRGGGGERLVPLARLVNCSGPQGDVAAAADPLLRDLLASGRGRPDALRIGLDVTGEGALVDAAGRPDPRVVVVGPPARAALWEVVAVPDIRVQVQAVAERIARAVGPEESRRWA